MVTKNIALFTAGFFSCAFIFLIIFGITQTSAEIPLISGLSNSKTSAPTDHVSENDIILYEDKIIINIANASISRYAATGSMKPVFDEGANGIRIVPKSINEIDVGDIISFRKSGKLIVHRVVEKGEEENKTYFITKGDNNEFSDGKVYFEEIEYKTIGVLW